MESFPFSPGARRVVIAPRPVATNAGTCETAVIIEHEEFHVNQQRDHRSGLREFRGG
jgi:hypothetical protein